MELYIKGAGIVSPAGDNSSADFLSEAPVYNTDHLLCKEPDYTGLIAPMQLRRMSKAVRISIAASSICLKQAGVEKMDALSVGTAMGCLYDTENFLSKMVAQDEQMLTPTAFIQSTHNTVAGQIALVNGCFGHNLTYTQRGHSFEHALINAQLYLNEHPSENLLAGGIDELTDSSLAILQEAGVYRKDAATANKVLHGTGVGSLAGEGAAFFILNKNSNNGKQLCIRDLSAFMVKDQEMALQKTNEFIAQLPIAKNDIDLVMLGVNGDERSTAFYNTLKTGVFKNNAQAAFKHLCGEYATASSFALGLLNNMVQSGKTPDFIFLTEQAKQLKHIVLVNHFQHYYSCWHLTVS